MLDTVFLDFFHTDWLELAHDHENINKMGYLCPVVRHSYHFRKQTNKKKIVFACIFSRICSISCPVSTGEVYISFVSQNQAHCVKLRHA